MLNSQQVHLPSEKINEELTYADYEGFLTTIYLNLLPLAKSYNEEITDFFSDIEVRLNFLCKRACGREIKVALASPSPSHTRPLYWNNKLVLSQVLDLIESFWYEFGFSRFEEDQDTFQFFVVIELVCRVVDKLGIIKDWDLRKGGPAPVLVTREIHKGHWFHNSLDKIIEMDNLSHSEIFKSTLNKDRADLFLTIQNLYGPGMAYVIMAEAEQLPRGVDEQMKLSRWQEVFRAAPPKSATSEKAWQKIEELLKEK